MEPEGKLVIVAPGDFDVVNHFYPRVLNAQLHPVMRYFFNFTRDRIISRYHHLHPFVDVDKLEELVTYQPSFFRWVGSDLFAVTTGDGFRHMMVIETNSCPSGQKSTPFIEEMDQGGYFHLMSKTFAPLIESVDEKAGGLAVIYDKNFMEASGYASAMADLSGEQVFLARMPRGDSDPITRFTSDGVLQVKSLEGEWLPMRAAFRYVTQSPWDRIPLKTKTMILNPIIACVSGGRNKLVASKAYDLLNSELIGTGLKIRTPETIWDVSIAEVPLWIKRMGGIGVVKNPYSNAGQGVWTITNTRDCDKFRQASHQYSKFIVQKLIGNSTWHDMSTKKQVYHLGTVPDKNGRIYISDLRMMIHATSKGFRPLATYARRARKPLTRELPVEGDSWDMIGTNLSIKNPDGSWGTDTKRLLLMDSRDFNKLGIGIDDLVDSFIQTVLCAVAIDKMARKLFKDGVFDMRLFRSIDPDHKLIDEIKKSNPDLG